MTQPDPPDRADPPPPVDESADAVIGRYRLLQRLGEGGFGEVWMAQQDEPVKRTVALKILKAGMDTAQVVARFEQERQALALMDHPNIAKVLDGGATARGRPYFVMELVKGVPITRFCDQTRLTMSRRLDLFRQVCAAVQHAHQKGIIHRDLKPSNILVAIHDGAPVPKVIDFGIAKALTAPLTERTMFTLIGQMLGTPEYMAPEQAETSGLDVDTRADIYSLGVVLYELLTGTRPFDTRMLLEVGQLEILRTIREVDPPKPSTRISTLGEQADQVAQQRRIGPRQLGRTLRGDLDWIVMKALEKERSRRYETAAALAEDLERHLDDRPVLAGPPSTAYRLRKYVRRHRVGVAASVAVAATMVAGLVATASGYVAASASAQKAQTEATRAGMVIALLDSMLGGADPYGGKGMDYTVRQLLDDFDRDLGDELETEPEVEATVRSVLGRTYRGLGLNDKAEEHLGRALALCRRTLGEAALPTLKLRADWANLLYHKGDYAGAEREAGEGLAAAQRLSAESPLVARFLHTRGVQLERLDRVEEAEAALRQALAMRERLCGPESMDTAMTQFALAFVLRGNKQAEKRQEAERLLRRHIEIVKKERDAEHPNIASALDNLGWLAIRRGAHEEAEGYLREAVDILRRRLGEDHADYATALFTLGVVRHTRGDDTEAEALLLRAEAIYRRRLGDDHPEVATALAQLGAVRSHAGDQTGAEQDLRAALAILRKQPAGSQSTLVLALSELAPVLRARGDHEGEVQATGEVLELKRAQHPADSPEVTGWCLQQALALTRLALDKGSAEPARSAQALAREALAGRRRHLLEDHWMVGLPKLVLADALAVEASFEDAAVANLDEAESLVRESGEVLGDATRFPASVRERLVAVILEQSTRVFETLQRLRPSDERQQRAAAWRAKLAARPGDRPEGGK